MGEDKPFIEHLVQTPGDILLLTSWLQESIDPIGLCVRHRGRGYQVAFAGAAEIFVLGKDDTGLCRGAVQAAIMGGNPPHFVARNATEALEGLYRWLKTDDKDLFDSLSTLIVGDLLAAGGVTGHTVLPSKRLKRVVEDAYDTRLLEPQIQYESPRYYVAISLPWARLQAENRLFGAEKKIDWWVSYPDLWIRLLVHWTGDPTLTWALQEERDPIEVVSRLLETPPEQASSLLIWQGLSRDTATMTEVFPQAAKTLPNSLPNWANKLDRQLPVLCNGINTLAHNYRNQREATTLYGRKLRGGLHPAYGLHHTIFGSVLDIIQVAAVTFWQGQGVILKDVDTDPISRLLRIRGTVPEYGGIDQWQEKIRELSLLAQPLNLPLSLSPTIVIP